MSGQYRPATDVQPGWHIRMTDDHGNPGWYEVAMVVETETETGERRLRFVCQGDKIAVAVKSDQVMSRTPDEAQEDRSST